MTCLIIFRCLNIKYKYILTIRPGTSRVDVVLSHHSVAAGQDEAQAVAGEKELTNPLYGRGGGEVSIRTRERERERERCFDSSEGSV